MTGKFYQLKEGQEEGIYTGLGIIKAGQTYQVYGEAQHEQVKSDPRFKFVTAPGEGVTESPTVDTEAKADAKKPADSGKGGK